MLSATDSTDDIDAVVVAFKKLISQELTHFSSSILLDPEYGLPAANVRAEFSGLLLAYEKTGYDTSEPGRLPDLLEDWSVERLKNEGADAIKFLLYYDADEDEKINRIKHVFMERIGAECKALDMPFFLEIVTYDTDIIDVKGPEFAKVKPHKVIQAMKEFSKPAYYVDVLKVEIPVNMNYVEGFATMNQEAVYTKDEAMAYFKEQSESTHIPFIFLSAGVSMNLFKETLMRSEEHTSELQSYTTLFRSKEFSKPAYYVDVLKVEIPVNMNYVEGFATMNQEAVYTKDEAMAYFKEQSESTHIPFIFLSAGVSMNLFKETLMLAKTAGSTFNGVLCGRATWKDSVGIFAESGEQKTIEWLQTTGKNNIESLNEVLKDTASPWTDYYTVE